MPSNISSNSHARPTLRTDAEIAEERAIAERVVRTGRSWAMAHHDLVMGCADIADGVVWIVDGAPSPAHWIAPQLDVEVCTVRDWIRVGRTFRELHASADAWASGEISYAKARALASLLTSENEAELLKIAKSVPASEIGRALARWSQANEDDETIDRRHRAGRSYRSRVEPDGTIVTTIRQPPAVGAAVNAAVDAEVMRTPPTPDDAGRIGSLAQQRHDAFDRLIVSGGGTASYEVLIHCDETGTRLPDGTPLTEHTVIGLLGQARIRAIVHDTNGRPVNASTARRHPTIRQQRVVETREPVCSRCGSAALLHIHHHPPFEQTRRTHTDELTRLCAPCHRMEHGAAHRAR